MTFGSEKFVLNPHKKLQTYLPKFISTCVCKEATFGPNFSFIDLVDISPSKIRFRKSDMIDDIYGG